MWASRPKWVRHIYEKYGIYTVLNHAVARYGVTVGGVFNPNTDYSDPRARAVVMAEIEDMVSAFKDTPGVLMWLLGNENNYGLVWSSAETEDMPTGEADAYRARHMYSLFGDVAKRIKEMDPTRPIAMANGDLQYIDIIAEEIPDLDVFGTNVYRGISFNTLFQEVHEKLGRPVMFTEFGADVWDAKNMREDQVTQARYLIEQWREIYEQSAGKGMVGNSIGGLTFQWTDGWWKVRARSRGLDIQDTNASWANDAYPEDFVEGDNNMNEEWWGIVAKGPTDHKQPLRTLTRGPPTTRCRRRTNSIRMPPGTDRHGHPGALRLDPAGQHGTAGARRPRRPAGHRPRPAVHLSGVRIELETFSTGGSLVSTPNEAPERARPLPPAFRGFDKMQSLLRGCRGAAHPEHDREHVGQHPGQRPHESHRRALLREPGPPAEHQGRRPGLRAAGHRAAEGLQRKHLVGRQVVLARGLLPHRPLPLGLRGRLLRTVSRGQLRAQHGHVQRGRAGRNGDQREAGAWAGSGSRSVPSCGGVRTRPCWSSTGPASVPSRPPPSSRRTWRRRARPPAPSPFPCPPTRKATLHLAATGGNATFEVGGIWSGSTKEGQPFQVVRGSPGSYEVLGDEIKPSDALGAKAKIELTRGRLSWYLQGASMGLVADGGFTQTQTFTGWTLKDTGSGNQRNLITGFAITAGNWQVAPNFMWRKPLVGAGARRRSHSGTSPATSWTTPSRCAATARPARPKILFTYDPTTPATWMYTWDSDIREDARFATSFGFVYFNFPTTQDAGIGIFADGRSTFAFPGAPPARDLWEVKARVVSKGSGSGSSGMIANVFAGKGEPNGSDERVINRAGLDLRLIGGSMKFQGMARVNDWGPYDYHRDFNHTFPLQLTGDVSYSLGPPQWFDMPQTRFGVRATMRTLNEHSPRYCPGMSADEFGRMECNPDLGGATGASGRSGRTCTSGCSGAFGDRRPQLR